MGLEIRLSKHAKIAIASRKIKIQSILTALKNPDEKFFDISTKHTVIIKQFGGKALIVVYDITNGAYEIVTVFATTKTEMIIRRKVEIGYWARLNES